MGLRRAGSQEDRRHEDGPRAHHAHAEGLPRLSPPEPAADAEYTLEGTFARMADVSPEALLAIFRRYGRPLDVAMPAPAPDDQRHVLGASDAPRAVVRALQVRGYGDVIPNDYFVLEPHASQNSQNSNSDDGEALAVSGPFFAAALEALARARAVRHS